MTKQEFSKLVNTSRANVYLPSQGTASTQVSSQKYIPRDANGTPISLSRQTVNGQDIPLPDPNASGLHTTLGGKVSSKNGELYLQSATFPEGAWSTANGQNVPWSEVHWSNHGRGDHTIPHQTIFNYDWNNNFCVREKNTPGYK